MIISMDDEIARKGIKEVRILSYRYCCCTERQLRVVLVSVSYFLHYCVCRLHFSVLSIPS